MVLALTLLSAVTACQQEDADPGRARESVAPSSDDSESPTESATAAPTSPGTDPDSMYAVLVAVAPIPAREPLADAQMKGWFELHFVRGDEVVPGAVTSTEGLDGVAQDAIAKGAQITEDSFG